MAKRRIRVVWEPLIDEDQWDKIGSPIVMSTIRLANELKIQGEDFSPVQINWAETHE